MLYYNWLLIGWTLYLLAEIILVCLVDYRWFIVLSILFYLGLMIINL